MSPHIVIRSYPGALASRRAARLGVILPVCACAILVWTGCGERGIEEHIVPKGVERVPPPEPEGSGPAAL